MTILDTLNEINADLELTEMQNKFWCELDAYVNDFVNYMCSTPEQDRILNFRLFNLKYSAFDLKYKEIYNVNINSKYHGLYPRTYAGENVAKCIERHYTPIGTEYSHRKKHRFNKYPFSEQVLYCTLTYILAFLLKTSAYNGVLIPHLKLCFVLAVMEYFYAHHIDWRKVEETFTNIVKNYDFDVTLSQAQYLLVKHDEMMKKRIGRKHTKEHKQKVRIDLIEFTQLYKDGKTQTEIKKILAEKFNVSQITVGRIMKEYNLTRNYKTTTK